MMTYFVPRLGCAGSYLDVGLLTGLREDASDDAGAL